MLKINKISENDIIIEQGSIKLFTASVYFSFATENDIITISPKDISYNLPVFYSKRSSIKINDISAASMTIEETVKILNSFIGNFTKGGATSENNAAGGYTDSIKVSDPTHEAPKPDDLPVEAFQQDINKQFVYRSNEIQNKLADHKQRLRDYLQLVYVLSQRVFVADGNSAGSNSLRLDLLDGLYIQIAGTNVSIGNGSQESKIVDIRRSNIYATSTIGSFTGNNTTLASGSTVAIQALTSSQQSSDASVIGYLRDVATGNMYEFGYFISASAVRTTIFAKLLKDNRSAFASVTSANTPINILEQIAPDGTKREVVLSQNGTWVADRTGYIQRQANITHPSTAYAIFRISINGVLSWSTEYSGLLSTGLYELTSPTLVVVKGDTVEIESTGNGISNSLYYIPTRS